MIAVKTLKRARQEEKFSFYAGAGVSAWVLAVSVIAAGLYAPFKALLVSVFSHHWIGKTVLVIAFFLIAGFVFKGKTTMVGLSVGDFAWKSTFASLALILVFFLIEFFVK